MTALDQAAVEGNEIHHFHAHPQLARERALNAFVVADIEQKGKRLAMTFLVWQGRDGSVVGRWELAARKETLARVELEKCRDLKPVDLDDADAQSAAEKILAELR